MSTGDKSVEEMLFGESGVLERASQTQNTQTLDCDRLARTETKDDTSYPAPSNMLFTVSIADLPSEGGGRFWVCKKTTEERPGFYLSKIRVLLRGLKPLEGHDVSRFDLRCIDAKCLESFSFDHAFVTVTRLERAPAIVASTTVAIRSMAAAVGMWLKSGRDTVDLENGACFSDSRLMNTLDGGYSIEICVCVECKSD